MSSSEEILARHKKELKELNAKVTALKKQITKGDKKKKKEVTKEIEALENEVKKRHKDELNALESTDTVQEEAEVIGQVNEDNEEEEMSLAEQLLAEMGLDQPEEEQIETRNTSKSSGPSGAKRNRRKEKLAKREAEKAKIYQEALEEAKDMPDLRAQELETITALCDRQGLVQQDIAADGHCLFASISDQLAIRHGVKVSVQELRQQAAQYIREDPDTFSPFLFDENTLRLRDIEDYTKELETTALWGGDMEILALSKIYDCPISVLFSGRPEHLVNDTADAHNPVLRLVYYKHSFALGEHYSSLRDKAEKEGEK